jgi:hypothetical protein
MQKQFKRVSLAGMLMLLLGANLFAQAPDTLWTKTYGGTDYDDGESVQQTSDGGYIIAGGARSFGAGLSDVYLIKTDVHGDTLWTRAYGGTDYDHGYSVQQTSDGGYIVAGETKSFGAGNWDVYLIKIDASGDTLWTRTYGGTSSDGALSVQCTSDGGYIIVGYTSSFGSGVYLIKTDANGDTLWAKTYGGQIGYSVQQTSDGGYIIAGVGSNDIYLIKTDVNGETLLARTYGGDGYECGYSAQRTYDGGYIITGSTGSFGAGGEDVYVIRTDTDGDTLWTRTYGGTGDDWGYSVQEISDGYIIAGLTGSFGAGWSDVYLVKIDVNGNTLWTKTYGGTGDDWAHSVQQTQDGGYIITGLTESFGAGKWDVWLIKTGHETGIEEEEFVRETFFILQSRPNPFSQQTVIRYACPSKACLKIYDLSGRLTRTFDHSTPQDPMDNQPFNQIVWDGKDNAGKRVPNGVYFLRFNAGEYNTTRKLLMIR